MPEGCFAMEPLAHDCVVNPEMSDSEPLAHGLP